MPNIAIPFSPPDIRQCDIDDVAAVLRSGWITTGPVTKQFESDVAQLCGAERAVALNSATAGLFLALKLFGISHGDEVIVTSYTFAATANVILQVGATPVLCDINPDDFAINYDEIDRRITPRTKAIISVDYGGLPVDYDRINAIIESHKSVYSPTADTWQTRLGRMLFISDCAHSLGAAYKGENVGHQADISVFSLHAVKNLTTAEGGLATFMQIGDISADEIYQRLQLLSLHGMNKDALAKYKNNSWEYDILTAGYKYNMTDTLAALGASQLKRYDEILRRRAEITSLYKKEFAGTRVHCPLVDTADRIGSHHLMPVQIDDCDEQQRNEIIARMAECGIAVNVHYKPLPMFTLYRNLGFNIADYPNAYTRYHNLITLPIYPQLTDEQVNVVCDNLKKITD
jgi:dTDP-4-amino-4,6-dideoxygalactose transaminase